MQRRHLGLGLSAGLALVASCGSRTDYPSVEGEYWWYGSGVVFAEGKYGPSSELGAMGSHATRARLYTEGEQLFLDIPPCTRVALAQGGARGEILTAEAQRCELSPTQVALGLTSRTLTALRIDLDRHVLHQRYFQTGGFFPGSGATDSLFIPLGDSGSTGLGGAAGASGAGGAGGTEMTDAAGGADAAPALTVEDTESATIWAFASGDASLWVCDALDSASAGCVTGDGLLAVQNDLVRGTVHELKDGRYYVDGFDCFAPPDYVGEPQSCDQSVEGLGTPVPWVTRMVVADEHLSFAAEMIGLDYVYSVRLEADLTRLSELTLL